MRGRGSEIGRKQKPGHQWAVGQLQEADSLYTWSLQKAEAERIFKDIMA